MNWKNYTYNLRDGFKTFCDPWLIADAVIFILRCERIKYIGSSYKWTIHNNPLTGR